MVTLRNVSIRLCCSVVVFLGILAAISDPAHACRTAYTELNLKTPTVQFESLAMIKNHSFSGAGIRGNTTGLSTSSMSDDAMTDHEMNFPKLSKSIHTNDLPLLVGCCMIPPVQPWEGPNYEITCSMPTGN